MNSVLHLSNVMGSASGGVGAVVESYIRSHIRCNEHCHLWYAGRADLMDLKNFHPHAVSIKEIGFNNFIPPSLFYEFNRLIHPGSIIHQHGVFKPISLLTLTANKCAVRIVSPHGYLEPEKMMVSSRKKKLAMSLYELLNLKCSDALIACSDQEAGHLKSLNLAVPIYVVPNSIENKMCVSESDNNKIKSFRTKYNLNDDVKVLGMLSRIHPFKGHDLLIDVVFDLKEIFQRQKWVCFIAGVDENGYEEALKKNVSDRGLGELIKFVGPQFGEDKITFYDAIDCFVLPSRGENFGIVIAEAMARGLPVVTTKTTPWRILSDMHCGWWLDRDKAEFGRSISAILSMDDESLRQMGQIARGYVVKNFTHEKTFDLLQKVYSDVLQSRLA